MIPEEALDARANYVTQIKDVKWIEQRHKRIWRKQQLIIQIIPTNLSYVYVGDVGTSVLSLGRSPILELEVT